MQLMKRSFNKLVLGALMAAVCALGVVSVSAQEDEKTATYTKFTQCYKAQDEAGMKACITIGQDYMTKYGTPPDQYSDFVSKQLKNLTDRLAALPLKTAYALLNEGVTGKNWKKAFDGAREVIRLEPKETVKLDMNLYMAQLGYDLAFASPPDSTYNGDTLNHAKNALRMMDAGTVSDATPAANNTTVQNWGGGGAYALKTKDNASAWMNFIIGRLTSDTNKDTSRALAVFKEAAPYYYKSVKYESPDIKKLPLPYQNIGRYYLEELNAKVDEFNRTCKNLTEDTDQCKNIREMQLGYADRGLDAYARALKVAKDDPKLSQTFKDNLSKTVAQVYNARYKKAEGVNEYVAAVMTKPFVDPATPVAPIPEEVIPATTTGGAATTTPPGTKPATPATTAKPPVTAPANTTKPAATAPAKPSGAGKGTVAKAATKKKAGR
jgi:hypothetical protein